MNSITRLLFCALVLVGCNQDDVGEKQLKFSGTILNGDSGQPMSDVKIRLMLKGPDLVTGTN